MSHTKEPWDLMTVHAYGGPWLTISGQNRVPLAQIGQRTDTNKANGLRVVDCVNACANIVHPFQALKEAREALKALIKTFNPDEQCLYNFARPEIEKAREALRGLA